MSTNPARVVPRPADPAEALEPHRDGPWTPTLAAHLLRRALGGGSTEEVARLAALDPQAAVDAVFADPDPAVSRGWADVGATLARSAERRQLAGWWLMKMAQDTSAAGSRLALFLHDHFACTQSKTRDLPALYAQHQLFAEHGGGPLLDMVLGVLRDPAMLRFLDCDSNRRGAPNENLAREILELFTLGVGHYDEQDVREGARALTGYTVRQGAFRFVDAHHDGSPKRVLGQPVQDGEDFCRVAVAQPRCARFLAEKLWRWYVSPDPDDDVLDVLAERWRAHDLELRWMLRTLLGSRAFFAPTSVRSLVRSPVDFVVGTLRSLDARADYVGAARLCEEMGQTLFEPPGVQGWADGEAWIHAAAWIARTRFADGVVRRLDDEDLERLFGDAPLLERALELAWLSDLAPERRDQLRDILPASGGPREPRRVRELLRAVLCLPEVHLS